MRKLKKLLIIAAILEFLTGLALIAVPTTVITLLLGAGQGFGPALGRFLGIALVALGLACWPGRQGETPAAFRGMLAYNLLVALYLALLGTAGHFAGPLLWPAVAMHAVMAMTLLWLRRSSAV